MANIKSAIKRIHVTRRNEKKNKVVKAKVKNIFKRVTDLIESSNEQAVKLINEAIKAIDKAVSKGVIHKKTASRKKSRLVKRLNKATAKK